MRHSVCLTLMFMVAAISKAAPAAPLSISVICRPNPQCIFEGKKMYINIELKNNSQEDVLLTTKYMESRGPDIKITDVKTRKEHYTHVGVGDYSLLGDFERVPAGKSITMTDVIILDDIITYRKKLVELDVEVSFAAKWKFIGVDARELNTAGRFTIIGRDTLSRRYRIN